MKRICLLLCIGIISLVVLSEETFYLKGTLGGRSEIIIELTRHDDELLSGVYLKEDSIFYINPDHVKPDTKWIIRNNTPEVIGTWESMVIRGNFFFVVYKDMSGNKYPIKAKIIRK